MIGIVSDTVFMNHDTGESHPETLYRIPYIHSLFSPPGPGILMVDPVSASTDDIHLNHSREYIELIKRSCARGSGYLDPDTAYSEGSFDTALKAAGSLIRLVDMALRKEISSGFAFVRPPGHHSLHDRAMGFCLFNNVAIAAKKAQAEFGTGKVLIIDFDVHHGNGTQDSFYENDSVLYFSSHQYPYYPGTGSLTETGRGRGEGFTVNCPLGYSKTNGEFAAIYSYVLAPVLKAYKPGLVLVSAGFDAHMLDPIGGMQLTSEGYGMLAGIIQNAAGEVGAPVVYVLEGGYSLEGQKESAAHVINVLKGEKAPDIKPEECSELDRIVAQHKNLWPL
jgi:acetoin utilization deacetylase AcuC-like enzyme